MSCCPDLKPQPKSSLDELRERAKYIQMEETSRLRNEVRQARQKCDKRERGTKTDSYKSDKRQMLDKR